MAAATGGRGSSMSKILRKLVQDFLDAEVAEDAIDLDLARKRAATAEASHTTTEMREILASMG